MATEVSNIDDLLMGGSSPSIPATPESRYEEQPETPDTSYGDIESSEPDARDLESPQEEHEEPEAEEPKEREEDYDDYGNTKTPPKTYTEEEVNERINKAVRERLSRVIIRINSLHSNKWRNKLKVSSTTPIRRNLGKVN